MGEKRASWRILTGLRIFCRLTYYIYLYIYTLGVKDYKKNGQNPWTSRVYIALQLVLSAIASLKLDRALRLLSFEILSSLFFMLLKGSW